jgi:tRNA threonylcarbamoyladenosine biosynthesis protein TsaB
VLVLALDTTTPFGSCALARDGAVIREDAGDSQRPPASRLPGDLMTLLNAAGVSLAEVDVYAVATGPGSFTGLRVGIATMQGLAFAAGKPLIGISALDALADVGLQSPVSSLRFETSDPAPPETEDRRPETARIATWIDAWRGEVYAALYEDGLEVEPPAVEHPDQILARVARASRVTRFIGDGVLPNRDRIERAMGGEGRIADPATPLLAGIIARRATVCAQSGDRPAPHAIRPLYVRRPDAELTRDARTAG